MLLDALVVLLIYSEGSSYDKQQGITLHLWQGGYYDFDNWMRWASLGTSLPEHQPFPDTREMAYPLPLISLLRNDNKGHSPKTSTGPQVVSTMPTWSLPNSLGGRFPDTLCNVETVMVMLMAIKAPWKSSRRQISANSDVGGGGRVGVR